MQIMLCGASDTKDLEKEFAQVTVSLGGEPLHYVSGNILYLNSATATWKGNSSRTVAGADMCVFVILRRYGEITWGTELRDALNSGKPFLILCFDGTYNEYLTLTRSVPTTAIGDPDKRQLVETLTELESERQLTVATFDHSNFKDVYRREAGKLFEHALRILAATTNRQALVARLSDSAKLTLRDLVAVEELACDEFEDKNVRKAAIAVLIARSASSPETIVSLINSREQGVQRFAIANLPLLYLVRPPERDFLDDCVTLANNCDDTGVVRRLIPVLFGMGVHEALQACQSLDFSEVGTRRRIASVLEENESAIIDLGDTTRAIALLEKCLSKHAETDWIARGNTYLRRLKGD